MKPLNDGSKSVVLFNRSGSATNMTVNWSDINMSGTLSVRDLWDHIEKGSFSGSYSATVPSHGVVMIKVSNGTTIPVTGITLDKTSIVINESGMLTLTASVFPTNATNKNISWVSGNPNIATVISSGNNTATVKGVTPGICTITATTQDQNKIATCTVTINFADTICNNSKLTINLDGKLDDPAWNINSKSFNKVIFGDGTNVSANFKTWWNNQSLFIGIDVTDGHLNNNSANIWENSAVELFLDMNNAKTATYEINDFQYIIGWNNPNLFEQNNRTAGVLFKTMDKTAGFTVEASIPWITLGVTPFNGITLGFDVAIDISHIAGSRTGGLGWSGNQNNFQNTSKFGNLILENCIQISTSVKENAIQNLSIHPNPADDFVILEGIGNNSQIELFDILGKKIVSQLISANETKIDISGFSQGIYFFKITENHATVSCGKLIKK
ncbi:MAG: Ig-like domain-containing protein [Parachlamydiaceae bacterium]|nr:Ig-like domain-containing protein [Parachlamydiaceae bacterium]